MPAQPLPGLAEASRAIAEGSLSPVALTEATLARVTQLDPALHAFIEVTADRARAAAANAEREIRAGQRRGPLHGIPYGLKDLYDVAGLRTTAHSHLLLDNVATADSDATSRLEAAGMVLIGKLATHEFATGAPNNETPFPPARSPWNPDYFAGGSSSGAGVAVSAGMLPFAMGSDTGGSIRLPAAYCGIVGMKPTYGRLSRHGIIPLSFSLDHAGPLTRTAEDCALAMQVLAGYDPRDPGSANVPVPDYLACLRDGVRGLRIGYARVFNEEAGVGAEEARAMDEAARLLADLGAEVMDVTLPPKRLFDAAGWTVMHAEGFAIHQQDLRSRPEQYARITRERLMLGAFVSGPQYVQAQRLRRIITQQVDTVLDGCDVLLLAPVTGPAPRLADVEDVPLRRELPLTMMFNATGHPAMALPCGFSASGLPLSMQLVGRAFDEARVLRVGHAYEQAAGWMRQRPDISSLAA
jgi:aspartyl-tRNA(Asn)/glutamyl-tRNA(Gln) amidotransferase subunit A